MIPSSQILLGYIDPATGAIVLQAIVGGLLAAGVMFRRVLISPFARLLGWFGKPREQSVTSDGLAAQHEEHTQ